MSKKSQFLRLGGLGLLIFSLLLNACGDATATKAPAPTVSNGLTTAAATTNTDSNPAKNQPPVRVAVGSTAPDFTVKDLNGQSLQLSQFRGKAVLINFWSVY